MRKALLLLALLVIASGTTMATGTAEMDTGENYLELTKAQYYTDATQYLERKELFTERFREEFGVNLKVNTFPRDEYMTKLNLAITSGQLQGLVVPFTPGDVLRYREDGAILPMDAMLASNTTWYAQPEEFRETFKYYGETWALPTGLEPVMFARFARRDWLENLGMDVPETIDEFYEMARAFTEDDPDGNGMDDTVGLVSAGTWNLQDIFATFDARLNNFGADPICWDENEQAYVDSFLKPEAAEVLAFLNDLYENGYLDQETFTNNSSAMRSKLWSGKYGSAYYWMHWGTRQWLPTLNQTVPEGEVALLPQIKGNREQNINFTIGSSGGQYCILANTDNAGDMVNLFVDTFFGNEEAYLWGAHGIEGDTWRLDSQGRVLRWVDPATGQSTGPGLTGGRMFGWPADKYPVFDDVSPEEIREAERLREYEEENIARGREDGTLYHVTPAKDTFLSVKYSEIISDVRKIFDEVVVKAVTGEMSPQQALDQYRRQVKALGAQQALQECNGNYGSTLPDWSTY
jgi:ABC-type glycerol-3-phosphate transport system substrate-binding protein